MKELINTSFKLFLLSMSLILAIASCNTVSNPSSEQLAFDIKTLNSVEKRKHFLDSILKIDQQVRNDITEAQQKFGFKSNEMIEAEKKLIKVDQSNFQLIDEYLNTYGYPAIELYGKDANRTPWLVFHHVPPSNKIDYRHKNMQLLIKANEDGGLLDKDFSFLLNRMYLFRYGKSFTFEGSIKTSEEIEMLLKQLNY